MQHVSAPPALTSDPQRLMDEFPRWLEKVSSRIGGITLVLDSGDRFYVSDIIFHKSIREIYFVLLKRLKLDTLHFITKI